MADLTATTHALDAARARYKRAQDTYLHRLQKLIPVGTIVEVRIGRAWVRGPVLWHHDSALFRGHVEMTNEVTGKTRCAWVHDPTFRVVSRG